LNGDCTQAQAGRSRRATEEPPMNLTTPGSRGRPSLLRWTLICVAVVLLLGQLSGAIAGSSSEDPWFAALEKPATFPPGYLFGIVWTVLYILMGVALAMIVVARDSRWRRPALIAFAVQLVLNLAWSPMFFGEHQMSVALAIVLALAVAVIVTIVLFARVRRAAAVLLLPYLIWVLFAALLNWQFLSLNPQADGAEGPVIAQNAVA
jgi:tryptophan-rich sensory protein